MSADFGKLPPTAKPYGGKWGAATHASVRDLWAHKDLGPFDDAFSTTVPGGGASVTLRVSSA